MPPAPADPHEQSIVEKRSQMDELLQEFRAAQVGVVPAQGLPRRLYHYTTLDGLLGITASSALWASDVRYMNDASELSYAKQLISGVVAQAFSEVNNETLLPALPKRPGFANAFEYGVRPFVACFCEEGDLLSQWRGYRGNETGYSLGVELTLLAALNLPPNTYLRKVVYDPAQQRREVREVVDVWLQTAASMLKPDRGLRVEDVFPYPAIWALQEVLAEPHACFKHPAFAEEHEWRLIKLVDVREELRLLDDRRREEMLRAAAEQMRELGGEMPEVPRNWGGANAEGIEIKFRRSPVGLVPYVELPLRDPSGVFTGRLPLSEVIHGPTSNAELHLESVATYLESRGYGIHTDVKVSEIPLRQ